MGLQEVEFVGLDGVRIAMAPASVTCKGGGAATQRSPVGNPTRRAVI